MKDADALIDRILYLEGVPNMQRIDPVRVGEDVPEQHRLDLELETSAIQRFNRAIALCVEHGDDGTRTLLESILKDEEASAEWLETQLHLIEQIGAQAYLAQQLHA